jgi:hypothetical protein
MAGGWFRERYRHYLASKGVSTAKYAAPKYSSLSSPQKDILPGGKADYMSDDNFDPMQLAKGVKHELEHTKNEQMAKEIAKDHLVEDPFYYDHLDEMEKQVARKGIFSTDQTESAKDYAERNLKSSLEGKDRIKLFEEGVKKTIFQPGKDLDEEWQEYTWLKTGKPEPLSPDGTMERYIQRGAALVGRVTTQANIEPLLDTKMERSFRDSSMDFMFGRKES